MKSSKASTFSIILASTLLLNTVHGADAADGVSTFDFGEASKAAEMLETQIEISITNKNSPFFSDTFELCVTFTRPVNEENWFEYHRTEVVPRSHDVVYAKKVLVPYLFHERRELGFQIFITIKPELHENTRNLNDLRALGTASCKLAELMKAKKLELPVKYEKGRWQDYRTGVLIVRAEILVNKYDHVGLKFKGDDMKAPHHWFSKSPPYFEIFKEIETIEKKVFQSEPTKDYTLVYRSEPETVHPLSPEWNSFMVFVNSLCNGNPVRKLKFVCKNEKDLIAGFETSLEELKEPKKQFTLKSHDKKGENTVGQITVEKFEYKPAFSFADYVANGLKIRCYIAIDFTTQSGNTAIEKPYDKYEEAITLAVTALKDYVWDNKFATFGFGAQNADGSSIDKFSLNPSAEGAEGVLSAYREKLPHVTRGTKADIGPIIGMVDEQVWTDYKSSEYTILLVIMHREMSESQKFTFLKAMKNIERKPIALIILGLNNSISFKMRDLYLKEVLNNKNAWDTVNVFPFDQFTSYDTDDAKSYFGTELLSKLPKQVVQFMSANKLEPGL